MLKLDITHRIKRRQKALLRLMIVTVLMTCIMYLLYKINLDKSFIFDMSTMMVSALVSTILAIYITKDDIMENDYTEKKEEFGIITFEKGYNEIFRSEDGRNYLKADNWNYFFQNSKDHKIVIVAVHANGFFDHDEWIKCLLNLALNNKYIVNIILANPYNDEVISEAVAERKESPDHIKDKIIATKKAFQLEIEYLDSCAEDGEIKPSAILKERFRLLFSDTLPKALIFRTGQYMIVSPYSFESPEYAPTLIIERSRGTSFYDNYERYINRMIEKAIPFEDLKKHVSPEKFFDQQYDKLSSEFYEDLQQCQSLDILGLGQKHMLTTLRQELIELVDRGGRIGAVLSDPNGDSTKMCANRSLDNKRVSDACSEHVLAINKLIDMKQKRPNADIKVYIWDCFFPYTMYIFNYNKDDKDCENRKNIKIYLWITNLFEESRMRHGFLIDEKFDSELVKRYIKQYDAVLNVAHEQNERCKEEIAAKYNVKIKFADKLLNEDSSKARAYQVVRLRDGKDEITDSKWDTDTGVLSFDTDRFSTYEITYRDMGKEM